MSDKIEKERKELKVSLGLLVGYLLAGLINMLAYEKSWQEAYSQKEVVYAFAGIALSLLIIASLKRKKTTEE